VKYFERFEYIYIANCYFFEGKKISLDISPYVANSEIKITYASNNIIPTLENLTCEFFRNKTLEAVKDFQSKNGLKVDGVVGIKTMEILRK